MVPPAESGALAALAQEHAERVAVLDELFGAKKPTRIEVTSEDIACGREECSIYCPIALAIRRKTGLVYHVMPERLDPPFVRAGEPRPSIPLSAEMKKWINKYDSGEKVEPFGFDLPPLD